MKNPFHLSVDLEMSNRKLVCEFHSVLNVISFEISVKLKESLVIKVLKFLHLIDESDLYIYPCYFKFIGSDKEFLHYFSKVKTANSSLLKLPVVKEFLEKVDCFVKDKMNKDYLVEAETA